MRLCASWLLLFSLGSSVGGCTDRSAGAQAKPALETLGGASAPTSGAVPVDTSAPLPGIDLGGLTESERVAFGRLTAKYPSACGKAHSLAVSVRTDPGCRRSVFAVRYIVRLIRAHLLESE